MKKRRPFSSSSSQVNIKKNKSKKKLRILSACISSSELIPNNIKSLKHTNYYTNNNSSLSKRISSRPQTSSISMNSKISKMNLFGKSQSDLDYLSLMIDSNPSQYNSKYIHSKMKQINPLYIIGSDENMKRPKFSYNTEEVYYKYNLLYANKTQNLIKTYSPKMRPMSSSIKGFLKKMYYNLKENLPIFTEEEIMQFCQAKCKDLGIEIRDNILNKFKEFCKMRCKNRAADLSDSYFGINSVKFLVGIIYNSNRISRLNLRKNNIGDMGLELLLNALKDSLTLVSLDISSNNITYKGGQKIFKTFVSQQSIIDLNLESLEGINRNHLTAKGIKNIVKYLKNNFFIETLNLSGTSIKNEGFDLICKGLNNNITLYNLNISNNDIQESGLKNSIKHIEITKLHSINLSNNPIMDEGLIILTNNLRHFPELRVINVSNCGIEYKGFKELLKILQSVRRVESLDISKNRLTTNKFEELKPFFCAFGIKYLNISRCQLGDEGIFHLGGCLALNETIRKINISNNKFSDRGFRSFINLFNNNNTIESFDCSSNFITDLTMKEFLYSLEHNHTLKYLNLYDNQLHKDMGSLLLEILETNKTLLNINLLYNRIQLKTIEEIKEKLKSNYGKEKAKYVPNLMKSIKDLGFKPEDFSNLIKQIKSKKAQQIILAKKVKEDNKEYVNLLAKENKLVKQKDLKLVKLKEGIKSLEIKIREIDKNIKLVDNNYAINEKQIKGRINEEKQIYEQIDMKNRKLKVEYDLIKNELDDVINNTKIRYKESQENSLLAQNTLNDMNEKLSNLKVLYEDLNNPDLLVAIPRRNSVGKRRTLRGKGKLNRRMSNADIKKIDGNLNYNMSPTKPENINITASTSPTNVANQTSNRNSIKKISSKKAFQINKNK